MLEIGAFEAKNTLGSLLDRVQNGEEVLITRHGRPVARLVPNTRLAPDGKPIDQQQVDAAMKRIRDRAMKMGLKFDWEEVKRSRDMGRR